MGKPADIRELVYGWTADEVRERLQASPGTYLVWRNHLDTCGLCAEVGGCRTEAQLWAACRRAAS